MAHDSVGAVVVVEKSKLVGIFTERDLMLKVVQERRDPSSLQVRDVMTSM
jgi:CBS domain-containing protein